MLGFYPLAGAPLADDGQNAGGVVSHNATGVLTGTGSAIVGSAAHIAIHASIGILTGQGSVVTGAATRTAVHASSGILIGQGSTVAGSAAHIAIHASSGVLTGQGSTLSGSAARLRAFDASGILIGQGSVVAGSADRSTVAGTHDGTGALVGQGSTIAGTAKRLRAFNASGALIGQGSLVTGDAARAGVAVSHDATGVLVGAGSAVTGAASIGVIAPYIDPVALPVRRADGSKKRRTDLEAVIAERDGKQIVAKDDEASAGQSNLGKPALAKPDYSASMARMAETVAALKRTASELAQKQTPDNWFEREMITAGKEYAARLSDNDDELAILLLLAA